MVDVQHCDSPQDRMVWRGSGGSCHTGVGGGATVRGWGSRQAFAAVRQGGRGADREIRRRQGAGHGVRGIAAVASVRHEVHPGFRAGSQVLLHPRDPLSCHSPFGGRINSTSRLCGRNAMTSRLLRQERHDIQAIAAGTP